MRYQHNPADSGPTALQKYAEYLPSLYNLRHMVLVRTYGLWAPPSENLLVIGLIAWTVWRAWPLLSEVLKKHIRIAAIINIPLFVIFGTPGELRNLSMLYVTLLLLLAANLTAWMSGQATAATRQSVR
jgi:hypothetical protein